jgi:hypothetical protein
LHLEIGGWYDGRHERRTLAELDRWAVHAADAVRCDLDQLLDLAGAAAAAAASTASAAARRCYDGAAGSLPLRQTTASGGRTLCTSAGLPTHQRGSSSLVLLVHTSVR